MSHTPVELDDDLKSRAVTLLLAEATTTEFNAVKRTALRAGFMWRCTCRTDHYAITPTCDCGAPRPERLG